MISKASAPRAYQAKQAMDQVRSGARSFRENYDDAHGGTVDQRRAGWREAYRERVRQKEGREPATYRKPSQMTPEEREKHEAELERRKYEARKAKRHAAKNGGVVSVEKRPEPEAVPAGSLFGRCDWF